MDARPDTILAMTLRSLWCLVLLPVAVGCLTQTRTYSVSVRNDLGEPVTICLAKANGPAEAAWTTPEDLMLPPHPADEEVPGNWHLPPGKTARIRDVSGEFDPDRGRAFLRVYLGEPSLAQMAASDRGSYNRLDYPLKPGGNDLVVIRTAVGTVAAVPASAVTATPTTRPAAVR